MNRQSLFFVYLLICAVFIIAPKQSLAFAEETDLVSYAVFSEEEGWTEINATHDGYLVSSDIGRIDGLTASEDFFPWYVLRDNVLLVDFFNLDVSEANATVILHINGESKNNTVKLAEFLDENTTEGLASTLILVQSFLDKVAGANTGDARVWPVTLHVTAVTNNPQRWKFDMLVQRAEDNLDDVIEMNASLFAWPGLDITNLQRSDLGDVVHKQSKLFEASASGNSLKIQFDVFAYTDENERTVRPLSFIILLDNGAFLAIQDTSLGWIERFGVSDISNSWELVEEETPATTIGSESSRTNNDEKTSDNQDASISLTVFMVAIGLIIQQRRKLLKAYI